MADKAEKPDTLESMDDVIKFYNSLKGSTTKSPTGDKPKRSRKKSKRAEKDPAKVIKHEKTAVPTYRTIHFYLRPGDTWIELVKAGKEEIQYAGPGTLVFCHKHFHTDDCNEDCREVN
jgi:hypothetical protein